MKKLLLSTTIVLVLTATSCNNSETESGETIVKDSMGVTTAPVTDHVDSAAADTVASNPDQSVSNATTETNAPAGVQTSTGDFESADGKKVNAVYNNDGQMAVATLHIDGEEIKLMQTEATAKGAEYSNGKIKWKAEGNSAILTRDGKETKFSLKK